MWWRTARRCGDGRTGSQKRTLDLEPQTSDFKPRTSDYPQKNVLLVTYVLASPLRTDQPHAQGSESAARSRMISTELGRTLNFPRTVNQSAR